MFVCLEAGVSSRGGMPGVWGRREEEVAPLSVH